MFGYMTFITQVNSIKERSVGIIRALDKTKLFLNKSIYINMFKNIVILSFKS